MNAELVKGGRARVLVRLHEPCVAAGAQSVVAEARGEDLCAAPHVARLRAKDSRVSRRRQREERVPRALSNKQRRNSK